MNRKPEETFIQQLLSKARAAQNQQRDTGDARRDLAELRGVLREQPWDLYRASRHIVPALDEAGVAQDDDFKIRCFYQTAGLFALTYREIRQQKDVSFGAALRSLRPPDRAKRGSLDGHFLMLLNSNPDQLFVHLRRMISLLQAKGNINLDWTRLLVDIQWWDHDDHSIQKRWARDYYRDDAPKDDDDTTDAEGEGKTDEN